jgi:hypothetical protein
MELVAYVINTTPKYFYLLPLHVTCLFRYAELPPSKVFLATEVPDHPEIIALTAAFPQLHIIPLTQDQEGFFESRAAAIRALPPQYTLVFPMQEDFILEARPCVEDAITLFTDSAVASVRLMPCPRPALDAPTYKDSWKILEFGKNDYVFTYQATLLRREVYQTFMDTVITRVTEEFGSSLTPTQKAQIAIRHNFAEVSTGQEILRTLSKGFLHLSCIRAGSQPNAVYLAPWPYRPTAVVRGRLEPWARELAMRENVSLIEPTS